MPIQQNKDQTLSLVPENNASPPLPTLKPIQWSQDEESAVAPQQTSQVAYQGEEQLGMGAQQLPQVEWSPEEELATSMVGVNWTAQDEIDDIGGEASSVPRDIVGGMLEGWINQSFVANSATTIKSWLPYAPARVDVLDEQGNLQMPEVITVNEAIGMSDDKWEALPASERRKHISSYVRKETQKFTGANPSSNSYLIGNMIGMFADPTTAIPPLGTTRATRAGYGAIVGAADVGMYQNAQEGQVTPQGLLLGAGVGAAAGAIFSKANFKGSGHKDPNIRANQRQKLDEVYRVMDSEIEKAVNDGLSANMGYEVALRKLNMSSDELDIVISESGTRTIKHLNMRRERGGFDELFEPIAEELSTIAPNLYQTVSKMEMRSMQKFQEFTMGVDEFIRKDLNKLSGKAYDDVHTAMLTNDRAKLLPLAKQHFSKGWEKRFAAYEKVTHDARALSMTVRGKSKSTPVAPELDLYMHRAIKDYDVILKVLDKKQLSRLENIIVRESKGRVLTEADRGIIYSNFLAGRYDTKGMRISPAGVRSRVLTKKMFQDHPELIHAFHKPGEAMHSYLKSTVEDSYRKAAFGQKITDEFGDDINMDMLGAVAQREVDAGRLLEADMEKVKELLQLRFEVGMRGPSKGWGMVKDTVLASLLGNPISAITQLGDIAIASAKHGVISTADGIATTVRGKGLSPTEMGFAATIAEEMVSSAPTKTLLNKALTWSGFASVDRLGKAVALNSSLKGAFKMAQSRKGIVKLQAKWGAAFDKDFKHLLSDLANRKITENTKLLAFMELAEIQPITLLQMPKKWLQMENGRLLYMLRTFQMKYWNLLRQEGYYQIKAGNYKQGITAIGALVGAFTMGGASTDMIKGAVMNRDVHFEEALLDNLLKTTGVTDRYSAAKIATSSDPMSVVLSNLAPPVTVGSPILKALGGFAQDGHFKEQDLSKLVGQIPLFGKVWENWMLGGYEKWNAKHWQERIR